MIALLHQKQLEEKNREIAGLKYLIEVFTKERDALRVAFSEASQADCSAGPALEACRALVKRLDEVHKHPAYQAVWDLYTIRVGPYRGLTYDVELNAARNALNIKQ